MKRPGTLSRMSASVASVKGSAESLIMRVVGEAAGGAADFHCGEEADEEGWSETVTFSLKWCQQDCSDKFGEGDGEEREAEGPQPVEGR